MLRQYANFIGSVGLSHSFTSFLKQLKANYGVDPATIDPEKEHRDATAPDTVH